jgi:hypothetical protein
MQMKRTTSISLVLLFVSLAALGASACGDKLLHLSRIHRRNTFSGNGTVVVFSRPSSLLENAASINLAKAFQDAGLKLRLVNSERELADAIHFGVADVLIVDFADVGLVQRLTATTPPLVVPVIAKGDHKSEADAKHYVAVIKSPAKSGKFVDAVDRVFDADWAHGSSKIALAK